MTAAAPNITPEEQEQILQTIEMFEVITQANPQDCQSLEILKDAYQRVGKTAEALSAARRLADTYLALGQFSSAMLEYEGILQKQPDNAEVIAALGEVEERLAQERPAKPTPDDPAAGATQRRPRRRSISISRRVVDHGDPSLMTTAQTLRLEGSGDARGGDGAGHRSEAAPRTATRRSPSS